MTLPNTGLTLQHPSQQATSYPVSASPDFSYLTSSHHISSNLERVNFKVKAKVSWRPYTYQSVPVYPILTSAVSHGSRGS